MPLSGIFSSSPSPPLVILPAAAWFPQWRQRFRFLSTSISFPQLYHHCLCTVLISDWHVCSRELSREEGSINTFFEKYLFDIARHVRTTFFNGRIHFGNALRYVLGEVVQKEPADVEECLWHVGTEGLILEIKESLRERIKKMCTHIWVA